MQLVRIPSRNHQVIDWLLECIFVTQMLHFSRLTLSLTAHHSESCAPQRGQFGWPDYERRSLFSVTGVRHIIGRLYGWLRDQSWHLLIFLLDHIWGYDGHFIDVRLLFLLGECNE